MSNAQAEAMLGRGRLVSVDVLRGLVMVLMALDHARYYFSGAHVSPEDMAATDLPLFATRWVTHLCAPAFFFLTGLSIYLSRSRATPGYDCPVCRLRGAWLIVLELTVVGFAWSFNPGHSIAGVIWCLGWAMIFVGVLSLAPHAVALVVGIAMIASTTCSIRCEPPISGRWLDLEPVARAVGGAASVGRRLHRAVPADPMDRRRCARLWCRSVVLQGRRHSPANALDRRRRNACAVRRAAPDECVWKSLAAIDRRRDG